MDYAGLVVRLIRERAKSSNNLEGALHPCIALSWGKNRPFPGEFPNLRGSCRRRPAA
jgi:hypothetical protein